MKKGIVGALSLLLGGAAGAIGGAVSVGKTAGAEIQSWHQRSDKHLALYLMMNQWVKVKQEGKSISSYLEQEGYKRIAIYGMHYVGETLLNELKDTGIEVIYAIDRKAEQIYAEISVISTEDSLEEVDAIIVTAITFFDEIEEKLAEKVSCPIISLKDILYDI